jgi:hypothetical protein
LSKDVLYLVFLKQGELDKYLVSVNNGKLFDSEGALLNCFDDKKEYIFNIDLREDLYLVEPLNLIHHVSLSQGKPILGAGNMKVREGVIERIELESGHYLPYWRPTDYKRIDVEDFACCTLEYSDGLTLELHLDMVSQPPFRTSRIVDEFGSVF